MKKFTKSSAPLPEGEKFIGEDSPQTGRSDQRLKRARAIHKSVRTSRGKKK